MIRTFWPVLVALLVFTPETPGPSPQDAAAASTFSKEQLEQMVGPIALYPDSLITAVLTGATYPLEIVEADRWLDANKDKTGAALEAAMKDQTWDPAIKSLVMVPEVLKRMSTNLDWTRDLGDAFLGQQAELMDAVQRMRGKANEAGNLKDTTQQDVTVQQDQIIVIESTSPETVYVPEYGTAVYGSSYSYAQPYYGNMYPAGWGLLGFGAGVAVGGALWGDANWGWGNSNVDVDVNNYNNFNNKVNNDWKNQTNKNWNHNAEHRGGVGYKDNKVAQKYGGAGQGNRVASDKARGKATQQPGGGNRPGGAGGAGDNRPGGAGGAGNRPGGAGDNRPGGAGGAGGAGAAGGNRPGGAGGAGGAGAGGARPSQQPSGGGARPAQQRWGHVRSVPAEGG